MINRLSHLTGGRAYGPNRICSDTAPTPSKETSVSTCFKRGIKAGFAAAMRRMEPQVPPPPPAPPAPSVSFDRPRGPAGRRPRANIPRPFRAQPQLPSLEQLYLTTDYRASRRRVDFFKTLPIRNPDFQRGGSRYLTNNQKRALGTERLIQYLISTGEYRA